MSDATISTTHDPTTHDTAPTIGSRRRALLWFCTGSALTIAAAVMTTSGWSADAAPGDADATFVPTPGCRLLDTRPGPTNIGDRTTPLGPGDTHDVTVHGNNGQCTDTLAIPTDATGVALNATAVAATTSSNIRIYPANLAQPPLLSNLNVTAGAPPTPNKVDVQLSPDGAITAYNANGTVHLVLDVVGYYTDNTLTEIHQRLTRLETDRNLGDPGDPAGEVAAGVLERLEELESRTATNSAAIARTENEVGALDEAQPFSVSANTSTLTLSSAPRTAVFVDVTAPVDGHITASSTTNASGTGPPVRFLCSITDRNVLDPSYLQTWITPDGGYNTQLAGTRRFDVAAGATVRVKLICSFGAPGGTGDADAVNSVLTAIFTPAP